MKYNFDEPTDRTKIYSLKWDVADNELPMWVADMDFKTAPSIIEAMQKRLDNGTFGYSIVPEEWNEAYQNWWGRRHGFWMEKDWLIFCTGVVPAISSIVRKLTTPNENVLIQTPVYNIFFNSIINNGCRVLESPLRYEDGVYAIDFADLEEKLADPQTTLMILCNPHNPVGKIWDRQTLAHIGELCEKHHVTVIADEIHCDLTKPGMEYIPFASVSETCKQISITCIAPTKTFNLAGIQTAAVSVPNPQLRHKVWRGLNTDEVAEPNAFAMAATIAAFTSGEDWLDELRSYIWENRRMVEEFTAKELSGVKVVAGEATYLLWLDCSALLDREGGFLGMTDSVALAGYIRKKTGLYLSDGVEYGKSGRCFLRMNIACQREKIEDGLSRLHAALEAG